MMIDNTKAVMDKYMNPNEFVFVIIGDTKTLLENLNTVSIGKPFVLDKKGESVDKPKVERINLEQK